MFGKIINWYCDKTTKLFAYTIGYILFGIFYGLSRVFPFCRNILMEYEKETSLRSILFIDFFSISMISLLLVMIEKRLPIQLQDNMASLLLFYFIWIIFGYFALLALSGLRKKKTASGNQAKPSRKQMKKRISKKSRI
jgi:hypothetical protein